MNTENLVDTFEEFMNSPLVQGANVDAFFDYAGIPKEQRSDFVFSCILNHYYKRKEQKI